MGIEYSVYILKEYAKNNFYPTKAYIRNFIKKNSISGMIEQSEHDRVIFSFFTTSEIYNELATVIKMEFGYNIVEFSTIAYRHYHLHRYDDYNQMIHSATAYNVDENIWELYYDDGIIAHKIPNMIVGSLDDGGLYLFKVEMNEDGNETETLEKAFSKWLIEFYKVK
ncbi:DUF3986 family protein [Cytobacillus sp. IB215665]|uniref:DUF3986 family protein n=1 Tax=Cytobacillus sp. IB215665 TaxID=3097357 RepID=UPI002A137782|nr:DUF3986 family protein [Cytobacillus sp. IB215665]MDX8366561.1 hypothetical protein [Cytobacillus sp. IB215665]